MNGDTIFHKIMRREIPAEILFEDADVIAIRDIQPVSPTHILVIPKRTIATANDLKEADEALAGHMMIVAAQIARAQGLSSYRLVMNCGEEAGQSVFQLHLHLCGGRSLSWPPG